MEYEYLLMTAKSNTFSILHFSQLFKETHEAEYTIVSVINKDVIFFTIITIFASDTNYLLMQV